MGLPVWAGNAISNIAAPAVGGLFGWIGSRQQNCANMRMAQFQLDANRSLLREQLEYDTPKNQMQRFQDAGLNPHLIYGQGSPGNQSTPLSMPDVKPADIQGVWSNIVPQMIQSRLANSQVAAQDANTRRTGVLTQLNELQVRVLKANPLLDETGFNAIISALKSTAESKEAEATIDKATANWFTKKSQRDVQRLDKDGNVQIDIELSTMGNRKMNAELDLLEQRFNLGAADQKIKAEVLQSKEFQNAILEIQKNFMTDGDITPQHVYQFIILLLSKML